MKLSISMLSVLFALGLAHTPSAEAARHCNKGKPCGNSCISRDDVCHLDGGSAVSDSGYSAESRDERDSRVSARESGREEARRERSRLSRRDRRADRDDRDDAVSVRTQSSSAEQSKAKVCKRGKACGNSCIPANAVCHQ